MSGKKKQARSVSDFSHGELVWAKVSGFQHWPGQVTDPRQSFLVPHKMRKPPKENMILIRFFGSYDFHWVSLWSVDTYAKGLSKRFHSKSKSKLFLASLQEARFYLESGQVPDQFFADTGSVSTQPDNSNSDNMDAAPHRLESETGVGVAHSHGNSPTPPVSEDHEANWSWSSEVESRLSSMEQDNGWSSLLAQMEQEANVDVKSSRLRCLSAMRSVGLAPPQLYLGCQLGSFYS